MKKVKVLLVDNDEDELMFMRKGFESTGFFDVMGIVSDSNELFQLLSNSPETLPDLVISEFNMPCKNGIDIAKGIHDNSALSHICVIILSISAPKPIMQGVLNAGAYACFKKPEIFSQYAPFARMIYNKIVFNYSIRLLFLSFYTDTLKRELLTTVSK